MLSKFAAVLLATVLVALIALLAPASAPAQAKSKAKAPAQPALRCPKAGCGRVVQATWNHCGYCSHPLPYPWQKWAKLVTIPESAGGQIYGFVDSRRFAAGYKILDTSTGRIIGEATNEMLREMKMRDQEPDLLTRNNRRLEVFEDPETGATRLEVHHLPSGAKKPVVLPDGVKLSSFSSRPVWSASGSWLLLPTYQVDPSSGRSKWGYHLLSADRGWSKSDELPDRSFGWVPWQDLLYSAEGDRSALIDPSTRQKVRVLDASVKAFALDNRSPDGKLAAYGSPLKKVVSLQDGSVVASFSIPQAMTGHRWSPDSKFLALCGDGGEVRVVDARSGNIMRSMWSDLVLQDVVWSPDGKKLALINAFGGGGIWGSRP